MSVQYLFIKCQQSLRYHKVKKFTFTLLLLPLILAICLPAEALPSKTGMTNQNIAYYRMPNTTVGVGGASAGILFGIACQTTGDWILGIHGWSNIWDYVIPVRYDQNGNYLGFGYSNDSGGHIMGGYFVADAYMETGYDWIPGVGFCR